MLTTIDRSLPSVSLHIEMKTSDNQSMDPLAGVQETIAERAAGSSGSGSGGVDNHLQLAWIPDHQLSAVASLAHADGLIEEVGEITYNYFSGDGDVLTLKDVRKGDVANLTIVKIKPLPRSLALKVGESLNTLRATLEHAIYAEVEHLKGSPLSEREAKCVEMPARKDSASFVSWTKNSTRKRLPGLRQDDDLLERIAALQPFHGPGDENLHPMWLLASHSNATKHRRPAVIEILVRVVLDADEVPLCLEEVPKREETPALVGDILAVTATGTMRKLDIWPALGLNRPGTDMWPTLMNELRDLANWVRTTALPSLLTGVADSSYQLPARYNIQDGHEDERAAIATGSSKSAAEKSSEFFQAQILRRDWPSLLNGVPGGPTEAEASRWLDTQSDAQLIRRASHFKASRDPVDVRWNYGVICALARRVQKFTGRGAVR